RVHRDIGIRMTRKAPIVRYLHSAERHRIARPEGMDVETLARTHIHRLLPLACPRQIRGVGDLESRLVARNKAHVEPGGARHLSIISRRVGTMRPMRGKDCLEPEAL